MPALQAAAGIDELGFRRLMSGLLSESIPIGNYQCLSRGGTPDSISATQLKLLITAIAGKPGGFDIAADILHMRLHSDEKGNREHSTEVIETGRWLIERAPFTTEYDTQRDYCLGEIGRSCLGGELGRVVVGNVCRRLKAAVSAYATHSLYNECLIRTLFEAHPKAALREFFGCTAEELDRAVSAIDDLRASPLDLLTDADLFGWCDEEPQLRYPAIASAITIFIGEEEGDKRWTRRALSLLDRAPEREKVVGRYFAQMEIARLGSVARLESFAKLLEQLGRDRDPAVEKLICEERHRLEAAIENRRLADEHSRRAVEETFE